MKIRSQVLLLLLLIVSVFIAGVHWIRQDQSRRVTALTEKDAVDLNLAFDHFLLGREQSLDLFASPQFRDWNEVVTGAENHDAAALDPLLNDDALRAYQVNAAWVLGADGSHLYASNNIPAKEISDPSFDTNLHTALCNAAPGGCHYFVNTTEGVMEIRGVALRQSWPGAQPAGYFFAGRLLTPRDAQEMGAITGNEVHLTTAPALSWGTHQEEPGVITFERELKGPDGEVVAWLQVRHEMAAIAALQEATRQFASLLIFFAVAILILLALALQWLVSTPLHAMTRALHTRDLAPLERLSRRRSEIGELAALIAQFHAQRDQLIEQMDQHRAAQHALEDSEERLRQAQKMEAIGRLAGGVAHDFNNLLTAIVGYANLLSTRPDADPEARRQAATILQAGQQASALTHQLLAFSRKQMLQPRVIDVNLLLAKMEDLLRRIIGPQVEIRTDYIALHAAIKADPNQVEQVILNLAVNARDAMPRGGRLLLRTSNATLAAGQVAELPAGDYFLLEVADTGQGIDRETMKRIFEPFFTTKVTGKGTGLGLSTVYGIVRQSGGGIAVESEPGQGSTFRVYFPRSTEPLQTEAVQVATPARTTGGETILVVDDQKMVASLVADVLKGEGYKVLVAASPSEAIGHFRQSGIDLLITDIVMPRIDGRTLAEMARARHERVKILYISGYAEPASDEGSSTAPDAPYLFKPFEPEALARKVREILDGA